MNRRTSIKQLLLVGAVGVTSVSFFKWFQTAKEVAPGTFSPYKIVISELAETIIPRTDTPGAKDAGVELFIIDMLENCTGAKEQNNFMKGLKDLETYTSDQYKSTFVQCNRAAKMEILKHFEKKSNYPYAILNKIDGKLFGTPFFKKLKELTVEGYCTSQIGATKGLAYDYIPGTYDSCIPLTKNQRSWATK